MQDNPYSTLINIIREQGKAYNSPSIMLAEVIVPPPNLIIQIGDLQIWKENLLIADYLLPGYKRQCSQTGSGTITTKDSEEITNPYTILDSINATGQIIFTDTLQVGDVLAVIPTDDGQTYIIIARVVSL